MKSFGSCRKLTVQKWAEWNQALGQWSSQEDLSCTEGDRGSGSEAWGVQSLVNRWKAMQRERQEGARGVVEAEFTAFTCGGGGGLVAKSCPTLWPHGLWPTRLFCPWDSPGKNMGVGCHCLLQGIFPTQESKPDLLHCRQILYWLTYEGSPAFMCGNLRKERGSWEVQAWGLSPHPRASWQH